MIEYLPRFEQVKHLAWLRRQNAVCEKWEYARHLAALRRDPNIYAIEHDPPSADTAKNAFVSVWVYRLKEGETAWDCPPYSQRAEDWRERSKHPAEAVSIQALLERAQ